jgi:hypothetical protein
MLVKSTSVSFDSHSSERSFTIPLLLFEQSTSASEYSGAEMVENNDNENKTSAKLRTLIVFSLNRRPVGFLPLTKYTAKTTPRPVFYH